MKNNSVNIDSLWRDRKRTLFGLPWSFTKYRLTGEKLYVTTGLFSTKEEEVRLYRIMDVTLKRSFGEKLFRLGTLHVCSADKSTPEFDIRRIKKSRHVRDLLSGAVEEQRSEKGIVGREFLGDDIDADFDGPMGH